VLGKILSAADHPRVAVDRQVHRLSAIELRILERGQPDDAIPQRWRKALLRDIDLVGQNHRERFRQIDEQLSPVAFEEAPEDPALPPRLIGMVIFGNDPHPHHAARRISFVNESVHLLPRQPRKPGKEGELIFVGNETAVDKDRVLSVASRSLQGQGDEVPKAALRHSVLAREKAVVRTETDLRPRLHGPSQQQRSQLPRQHRRHRLREEDPKVRAVTRARSLQGSRDAGLRADIHQCARIFPPAGSVQIDGHKPAGLVLEKRVDADHELAVVGLGAAST
jgi:hypothetical protein